MIIENWVGVLVGIGIIKNWVGVLVGIGIIINWVGVIVGSGVCVNVGSGVLVAVGSGRGQIPSSLPVGSKPNASRHVLSTKKRAFSGYCAFPMMGEPACSAVKVSL